MAIELTEGAIARLINGESIPDTYPVLKVTDLRLVNIPSTEGQEAQDVYEIDLSDGIQTLPGVLSMEINFLAESKALQKGSVIQLVQFICEDIRGPLIIIVFELNVMHNNECENSSEAPSRMDGGLLAPTFVDLDLFHCPICAEFLSVPVYQCENGHMLCSTCYLKLSKKCPSCRTQTRYTRCRPIEKVLESLKMPCQNTAYGCKEILSHSDKLEHEKMCSYLPCSCPLVTCSFSGSQADLAKHCRSHSSIGHLLYDERTNVSMDVSQDYLIYQERIEGTVFIIRNISDPLYGNAVSVSCIGNHHVKVGFYYDITAIGSGLRLRSTTKVVQGLPTGKLVNLTDSLFIPHNPSSQTIKLLLSIWKYHEQPELVNTSTKRRKFATGGQLGNLKFKESDMLLSSDDSGHEAIS